MKLPAKIKILGDPIKIIEKVLEGKKGYWDEGKGIIVINKNLPKAGKFIILIHEAMHVIETMLIQNKTIKKRINHEFITSASFGLAAILIGADAAKGLTTKDLIKLIRSENERD